MESRLQSQSTLESRVESSSANIFHDVLDPSFKILIIGEGHSDKPYIQNNLTILKHLHHHERDYQLAVEHFDSSDEDLFEESIRKGKTDALIKSMRDVYPNIPGMLAPIEYAINTGRKVIPVDYPSFGTVCDDDDKREAHIAHKLNQIMDDSIFTVLLIGSNHVRDDRILRKRLFCPIEEQLVIIQHPTFKYPVARANSAGRVYELNKLL